MQSYHSGIERCTCRSSYAKRGKLQSHHSGIESGQGEREALQPLTGCNRTIVGLKAEDAEGEDDVVIVLQSHHSGIESIQPERPQQLLHGCNRTIVGLKVASVISELEGRQSCNRTIVGLKVD